MSASALRDRVVQRGPALRVLEVQERVADVLRQALRREVLHHLQGRLQATGKAAAYKLTTHDMSNGIETFSNSYRAKPSCSRWETCCTSRTSFSKLCRTA